MELIGVIVGLRVQRSSLKVGQAPLRRYDPAPLQAVPALTLSQSGVTGLTERGEPIVDVHSREHPASKNRSGANGISVGFTSHYDAMRARFGDHLIDGLAGENILVRTDRPFGETDLARGLLVETAGGATARLARVIFATPCVEFTRFALRHPDDARTDRTVTEALIFLAAGMRGYYARYSGDPVAIRLGDRVYRG